MLFLEKNWQQKRELNSDKIQEIAEKLDVTPLFAEICFQRGLDSVEKIESFIEIDETWFHDPFLIYEMDKAINRIIEAIQNNEKITIYGDYDADGITSTALLTETLDSIGANVNYYLPNRFIEGYGPNVEAFQTIINDETNLIITVDNGVSGHEAIEMAQNNEVDVIVTDHHEISDELPDAFAVIHPNHPKGNYPFKDLAGVGVALKLVMALTEEVPTEALELAAIGTVADLVSLTGENRAIVHYGLKMLKNTQRVGILQLLNIINIRPDQINEDAISFQLAPRLNAIGRLGDASSGVELLTTHELDVAQKIAEYVDEKNEERKDIVTEMTTEVFERIALENKQKEAIVLADENWHQGVLGIVASRVVEATNKPTLLFTIDSKTNIAKGSGRSIASINLHEALSSIQDSLLQFGGHHMAAGMSANVNELDDIENKLSKYVEQNITEEVVFVDAFSDISEMTVEAIQELDNLKPFGTDNTRPLIALKDVNVLQNRTVGTDEAHLKLLIEQDKKQLDIIAFQNGNINDFLFQNQEVSVAGYIEINEWNGFTKAQMQMKDIILPQPILIDQRLNDLSKKHFTSAHSTYVFYRKENYEYYQKYIPSSSQAVLLSTLDQAKEFSSQQNIIIVDCPKSITQFTETVADNLENPIFCYFYKKEHLFLKGVPTRDEFATAYKYIAQHKNIHLQKDGQLLAQQLKIESFKLIFIIKVFLEAKFVIIENGLLNIVNSPNKMDLNETNAMKNVKIQIEAEKIFLYSSFQEVMNLFDNN